MDILSSTGTRLQPPFKHFHANRSPPSISLPLNPHRPYLPLLRKNPSDTPRLRLCLAASHGPPQTDPPPTEDPIELSGFSTLKERVRIFTAVLFWMSLFFWASAFDKRNNGGPPNKGSMFRR